MKLSQANTSGESPLILFVTLHLFFYLKSNSWITLMLTKTRPFYKSPFKYPLTISKPCANILALIKDNIMRIGKFITLTALATGLLVVGGFVVPHGSSNADNPVPYTQNSFSCPDGTHMHVDLTAGSTCLPDAKTDPAPSVPVSTDPSAVTQPAQTNTSDTPTCH